jgi:hypothetical protein
MDRTLGMAKNLFPFGMKVTLNQLLLGPMVVPVVFAWTLILEKQMHRIPEKIKNDTWPTLMKGEATTLLWCGFSEKNGGRYLVRKDAVNVVNLATNFDRNGANV